MKDKDKNKPKTPGETLVDYTDFSYLEFTDDAENKNLRYFSLDSFRKSKEYKELSFFDKIKAENEFHKSRKALFYKKRKLFRDNEKAMVKYIDEYFYPYFDYTIIAVERDNTTGFYAMALQKGNEIIISYKGSDFDNMGNDWIHNIFKLPQDYLTDQGQQASRFFRQIADAKADAKITIAGHSLGGFLALEAAVDNVGYIDRIDKVYAFDAPGFMQEFIDNNKEIIDIFLKEGKILETELTFIGRIMHKLQNINVNSIIREDIYKNFLEALFVHPIGSFRKLYDFGDDDKILKKGRLEHKNSEDLGDKVTALSEAMQIKPNSYKDKETGFTMQVTLSRETLSINEFLGKVDKNLSWNEKEGFIEKIKKVKELDKNPKYLVRGAILKCDKGSHMRRVDLRLCHGVYFKGGPALHIEDCEVGEGKNIKSFGMCSQTNSICEPDILENWLMGYENTYIVKNDKKAKNLFGRYIKNNLLRALTTRSFLVCACGGLIEPVSSGQEYREGNDRDRTLVKKEINEIDKIEKDLYGEEEDYEIDEKDLYIQ